MMKGAQDEHSARLSRKVSLCGYPDIGLDAIWIYYLVMYNVLDLWIKTKLIHDGGLMKFATN